MTPPYSAGMSQYPRYAIYYAPAHRSDLDRFGAGLLGYDAFGGHDLPFPEELIRAVPDWRDLSADPRKYGFHATLKAPFSLAHGATEAELLDACASFVRKPRTIPVIKPIVDSISGFIAVVPEEPNAELECLAADCVREFDVFRAPLANEDRERRNPPRLTPRQRENLDRWGYPYVMEDFRFHMTLTGRLDAERLEPVIETLRNGFSALGLESLALDRIGLFRQDSAHSRFQILAHTSLAGP